MTPTRLSRQELLSTKSGIQPAPRFALHLAILGSTEVHAEKGLGRLWVIQYSFKEDVQAGRQPVAASGYYVVAFPLLSVRFTELDRRGRPSIVDSSWPRYRGFLCYQWRVGAASQSFSSRHHERLECRFEEVALGPKRTSCR